MYHFYRYKKSRPYYNINNIYYVCSYGGCASQEICHYLGNFGDVYHIHSRFPPNNLTKTGYDDNIFTIGSEWFSNKIIPNEEIYKYKVIFIYRNPIYSIYSRFNDKQHLLNIQCSDNNITISNCIEQKKDLFELDNFFDNYTTPNKDKNYNIYCIKYEDFWSNISKFNKLLFIPDINELYQIKKETFKNMTEYENLKEIYTSLLEKMDNMNSIEIR